jgi:hypothetical protein
VDLTIEVMLPPRGATDYSQEFHGSYRVLTIVAVYPMKDVPVVGMPRTGYVHVTGVPTPAGWSALTNEEIQRRLNSRLCRGRLNGERRCWGGIAAAIPAGARNALRIDRQVTVTWTQFKNFLQQLDEARALTDDDLSSGAD